MKPKTTGSKGDHVPTPTALEIELSKSISQVYTTRHNVAKLLASYRVKYLSGQAGCSSCPNCADLRAQIQKARAALVDLNLALR